MYQVGDPVTYPTTEMVLRSHVHDLITLKKTAFGRWQTDYALIRFPYFPHGRFRATRPTMPFPQGVALGFLVPAFQAEERRTGYAHQLST